MVSKEACLILGNSYWRNNNNNKAVVSFYYQLTAKQMPCGTHLHFLQYWQWKVLTKDISFIVTKAKRTGALESTYKKNRRNHSSHKDNSVRVLFRETGNMADIKKNLYIYINI